jgi:dephospho-CoA kinase
MLRIGLTGGIGSGKSTVAQRFRELGAVVIDADLLARAVVEPGSPGLAAIRARFGDAVLAPDGSLDRGALGAVVFADGQARKDLEAITHPLIGARTHSLMESAAPEAIVVHEVPLLAELGMAAAYHLTVAVGVDDDLRVARLTGGRGFSEADARARIAAQASDLQRREAADAWLDNNGTVEALQTRVDALWQDRIVGFNKNLLTRYARREPDRAILVEHDHWWRSTAARLSRRVSLALGGRAVAVEHIGSTAVPGLIARAVIELQVGVRALGDDDEGAFVKALADRGFPRSGDHTFGSADPGRDVRLHAAQVAGPAWRRALLLRDWLRASVGEREAYAELKSLAARSGTTMAAYTAARETWLEEGFSRAEAWARHTGWRAAGE